MNTAPQDESESPAREVIDTIISLIDTEDMDSLIWGIIDHQAKIKLKEDPHLVAEKMQAVEDAFALMSSVLHVNDSTICLRVSFEGYEREIDLMENIEAGIRDAKTTDISPIAAEEMQAGIDYIISRLQALKLAVSA